MKIQTHLQVLPLEAHSWAEALAASVAEMSMAWQPQQTPLAHFPNADLMQKSITCGLSLVHRWSSVKNGAIGLSFPLQNTYSRAEKELISFWEMGMLSNRLNKKGSCS